MFWSRKLLKQNAKRVLAGSYWRVFLVWLLITLGVSAVASALSYVLILVPTIFVAFATIDSPGAYVAGIILIYLLLIVVMVIFNAFVSSPLSVGGIRYMMENRAGYPPIDTIFSTFRDKAQYLNVAKNMLLLWLEIFGFSLLFIIPGIVRSYQLVYVPYLLAENPYLSYKRAKELSKAMSNGEKMEIFVLQLSFIGWYLLACSPADWAFIS